MFTVSPFSSHPTPCCTQLFATKFLSFPALWGKESSRFDFSVFRKREGLGRPQGLGVQPARARPPRLCTKSPKSGKKSLLFFVRITSNCCWVWRIRQWKEGSWKCSCGISVGCGGFYKIKFFSYLWYWTVLLKFDFLKRMIHRTRSNISIIYMYLKCEGNQMGRREPLHRRLPRPHQNHN